MRYPGKFLVGFKTASGRRSRARAAYLIVGAGALVGCCSAREALAQIPLMAMPTTYETYNNVTQSFVPSSTISYTTLNNSYINALPQVPTRQFSFISLNPTPAGRNQFLRSTVPTFNADGTINQLVNATVPVAAGPNTSFAGLLLGRQWNGIDVSMTQCFGGGFAFNMQGSLMGTGAVAAPANSPVQGYSFSSASNYNEFAFGSTNPVAQVLTGANVSVGDFTQGWSNNAIGGGSMLTNYAVGEQNDPFTARGSGAATGPAFGFPNQVAIGPNLPPQPAASNNITNLGFESPVYSSSDAMGFLGVNVPNPFGTNNSRALATTSLGAGGVGPPASTRWAVLMAPSAGDRADFAIDIDREYAALIGAGVPASQIAVLYGNGLVNSLRIPGSTAPVNGSSMLAANNFPNINTINPGAGNLTTVPVQGGMDRATIAGLLAGTAATWTGLGLTAPPAGNGANLFIYTTGHGGSLNAGAADLNIANEKTNKGFANLVGVNGLANFNPAGTAQDTELQLAMSKALPDLTNGGLDSLWANGVDGAPTAVPLGAVTQVDPSNGSAYDISSLLQGDNSSGPPLYYYDVTLPYSDWISGAQSFDISLEALSLGDINDFDSSLEAVTVIDDTNTSDIANGYIDTYTATLDVPEPATSALLGAGLLVSVAISERRIRRAF